MPDPVPTVPPAQPHQPYQLPSPSATNLATAEQLFIPTNVWSAHLRFSSNQWVELGPKRVRPMRGWIRPDGSLNLRNPNASRAGVAGVFGLDFPWSKGDLDLGGVSLNNVAVRFKGNGTFLDARHSYRRPFKIDLDKDQPDRRFAGQASLNLHNLTADTSCLRDTLAYELFRAAGVPAPRTTFVRLRLTIDGKWSDRILGLYLIVEDPDHHWAAATFQTEGAAVFKPVTPELFHDLGADWKTYKEIYDPKTPVSDAQKARLLGLIQLVSHADDDEFARRIGEEFDLDRTAAFLACEALLAHFDGILNQGQNFLLWLDPRSGKFGFSPWDQDHSWGEFGMIGTREQRERASLDHPWVGQHRFLERLMAMPDFKRRYRAQLESLLTTHFEPNHLHRRIDELLEAIRPALAEESADRLDRCLAAIGESAAPSDPAGDPNHYRLKRFIDIRAKEAREQLDGKRTGVILSRRQRDSEG
ncbi:MAG: CotH kinase family protein [Verrucomicrobiales bacterium]|nr:CotH kinase family protein [Verrucomicrobiales bacterium]